MLLLDLGQEFFRLGIATQEEHRGFRERPLQMDIAHLRPTRAERFPGGLFLALHEASVGRELLHAIKARNVVDLVEDGQREDLADARDRPQAVERIGVVALRVTDEGRLQLADQGVIVVQERDIDFDAFAHAGVGETLGQAVAVRRIRDALLECRQLVLVARVLDVRE